MGGFPQCFGAIDGSHIPIITPTVDPLDYFNRKGFHSIVLQALVDHEYKFMNIFVGWPGSCHDAHILANSTVFAKGEAGDLVPDTKLRISGVDVPVVLLGDPAYPLLPWLNETLYSHWPINQRTKAIQLPAQQGTSGCGMHIRQLQLTITSIHPLRSYHLLM